MNQASSSRLRSLLRPANGIALLALCLALGGTAVAASTITGRLVKDNSLTGKDVRNRSLTRADFHGALRGSPGPRGPAGTAGERGLPGAPGAPGAPGDGERGPLIVEDYDATTLVPPGWRVRLDRQGAIVLEAGG